MRPYFATHDIADGTPINREHLGNFAMIHAARVKCADLYNLRICQFCFGGTFATNNNFPTLGNHVLDIIHSRSEKEVCRVIAKPHVTTVAYIHPNWDLSVKAFIRQAVRHVLAGFTSYISVSMTPSAIFPKQTFVVAPFVFRWKGYSIKVLREKHDVAVGVEMRGTKTGMDTALVPNSLAFRNGAVRQLICEPMRKSTSSLVGAEAPVSHAFAALPYYARIVSPLIRVVSKIRDGSLQVVETVNLVSHRRVLQWLTVLASQPVTRWGAFPILTQGAV